ncbi:predicted protein [Sclerotinia sclerotiorum 1980 UF-70]|uniref:Uncharacterized protein n=1 Tax=Sclerotinia sclerotiorum (strain ATCC 18683 / 1980 / Ss-1) TaxID=665079 RepID=A7EM32_SCLS1|nr:predicted protein [Sclerotinia sclerotiorum 1980 UF-70]EDO03898.1 predicted protein [Sclerotinia sclerotiorum 1980 UF-70]
MFSMRGVDFGPECSQVPHLDISTSIKDPSISNSSSLRYTADKLTVVLMESGGKTPRRELATVGNLTSRNKAHILNEAANPANFFSRQNAVDVVEHSYLHHVSKQRAESKSPRNLRGAPERRLRFA